MKRALGAAPESTQRPNRVGPLRNASPTPGLKIFRAPPRQPATVTVSHVRRATTADRCHAIELGARPAIVRARLALPAALRAGPHASAPVAHHGHRRAQ